MELLAAAAKHAAASDRRMGATAVRRRGRSRRATVRGPRKHRGAVEARPSRERPLSGAAPGYSAAAGTRADLSARRVAPPTIGGTDDLGDGRCAGSAGGAGD